MLTYPLYSEWLQLREVNGDAEKVHPQSLCLAVSSRGTACCLVVIGVRGASHIHLTSGASRRVNYVRGVMSKLPDLNRRSLEYVVRFLFKIQANSCALVTQMAG